ncbi:MAG: hypothetical protein AB7O37_18080 [Vicinamibacteria bacterium]
MPLDRRSRPAASLLPVLLLAACGASTAEGPGPSQAAASAAAADTASPFPLDRGGSAASPSTYKGLPLALVDNGEPSVDPVDGLIGLVCVGMSNASQECADFAQKRRSILNAEVNPEVVVVNCAVGGHAIERWIDPAFDAVLWDDCVARRLAAAGLALRHVRVVYHKAADADTGAPGGGARPAYPDPASDYFRFLDHLQAFAARVRQKFPAVQAVYTTSRSYGGFAGNAGRGEPLSFEEGLAQNAWLASHPVFDGVWFGWGPYIWAPDCATGVTNASGTCYVRSDYVEDGVHPARGALDKVSAMIHARFLRHAWYRR